MTLYLQSESTAARRKFTFVCVDETDGKTPETGLSFSSSEVSVRKAAGSYAAVTNIATITEIADGEYEGELTATELNTLGPLMLKIKKTGVRTTVIAMQVIAANLNDSVRLGLTALPNASAAASGGLITIGTGTGQLSVTSGSANAAVQSMAAGSLTATAIASNAITSAKIATDAIGAAQLAADAVSEIQSGLATASALSTVSGYIDTEVAAIKAKTDNLPSAPASTGDVTSSRDTLYNLINEVPSYVSANLTAEHGGGSWQTADVSGLATASAVAAIPTNPLLDDDARLDNLDAPISGIDTASLAAQLADIPADVWARVLDAAAPANTQTAEQILNLIAAVAYAPKTENASTGDVTIRDPGNTKDRVIGNVVNGARTLIGVDGS